MESMQNQFKSSMPTIIARLALGEDLDKICLDMAARITLSSVTDQALVQAGISSLFFYTNIKNITKSIDNVI